MKSQKMQESDLPDWCVLYLYVIVLEAIEETPSRRWPRKENEKPLQQVIPFFRALLKENADMWPNYMEIENKQYTTELLHIVLDKLVKESLVTRTEEESGQMNVSICDPKRKCKTSPKGRHQGRSKTSPKQRTQLELYQRAKSQLQISWKRLADEHQRFSVYAHQLAQQKHHSEQQNQLMRQKLQRERQYLMQQKKMLAQKHDLEKDFFQHEEREFQKEKETFQMEKDFFQQKKREFQKEKETFQMEKDFFQQKKREFQKEKETLLQKEKDFFQQKKREFQKEKDFFQQEKREFQKEKKQAWKIAMELHVKNLTILLTTYNIPVNEDHLRAGAFYMLKEEIYFSELWSDFCASATKELVATLQLTEEHQKTLMGQLQPDYVPDP